MMKVAGIVLAAGTSSRFGEANKLLALKGGKPMIEAVADAALAAGLDPVVVVTGHDAADIERALRGRDVVMVYNPGYQEGQSTSLAAGIRALPADCFAAMILLGDMPDIPAPVLAGLAETVRDTDDIVAPRYKGKRGNPVTWGRDHFDCLLDLRGDEGARSLLRKKEVTFVDVDEPGVLRDYDRPGDLDPASEGEK
jgi:molybdenum cofactor cytidylyltransferase